MKHSYIALLLAFFMLFYQFTYSQPFYRFYPQIRPVTVIDESGDTIPDPFGGGLMFPVISGMDLNGDYNTDLVVLDKSDNKVMTFINTGHGDTIKFSYSPLFEAFFPDTLQSFILLKDYNNDGLPDLFTYSGAFGAGLAVYKNTGKNLQDIRFELESPQLETYYYGNYDFPFNLPIYTVDIPAVVDFDGDKDLDILAFDPLGGAYLNLYNNFCRERYGHSDSLLFSSIDEYFGYFYENDVSNQLNLHVIPPEWMGKYKNYNQDYSKYNGIRGKIIIPEKFLRNNKRHAGSTVFMNDMDGDGDNDLLIGDIQYPGISLLINGKKEYNSLYDSIVEVDYHFPSYDLPVNIRNMPAVFYIDVNRDHIRDMIFSPIDIDFIDTFQSTNHVWLYTNQGENNKPDLHFQDSNFLVSNFIYTGGATQPAMVDADGDGDRDLIIVTKGDFSRTYHQHDYMILYENTGTNDSIVLKFKESDFLGFSQKGYQELTVCFADYNGDHAPDLIVGNKEGKIEFYKNTAGPGNPLAFAKDSLPALEVTSGYASPFLADLNADGLPDLITGQNAGYLTLYLNKGSAQLPVFQKYKDTLGGFFIEGSNHFTTPVVTDLNQNQKPDILVAFDEYVGSLGLLRGRFILFPDIDSTLTSPFDFFDTLIFDYHRKVFLQDNLGMRLRPCISDLDGDHKPDLIVGNKRGGLLFFGSRLDTFQKPDGLWEHDFKNNYVIFPNPAHEYLIFKSNSLSNYRLSYQICDLTGKVLIQGQVHENKEKINIAGLREGVYILRLSSKQGVNVRKFVKSAR